ncbi:45296_t:CDS:2 [Gigaspora margarita]|uniref:45296_t:CDS:1 n=1 Tax=Gigaspora margarita TaxID=4874 RepID=A0ABN7UK77_GIGMA|nr:45296_t:CDS:2 [Gigaspora margarita]
MDFDKPVEGEEEETEETEETEEKEISYIDSQLNYYIDKLNPKDNFNNVVKPNTLDGESGKNTLKIKDLKEKDQRKFIKEILEKSISTKSNTQKNRYKQVYDHIIDLVKGFDSHEILIEVWLPVLCNICISFRFLHESNFKRKKEHELYDKFISILISNCLKSLEK